jgi:hypothetical protein
MDSIRLKPNYPNQGKYQGADLLSAVMEGIRRQVFSSQSWKVSDLMPSHPSHGRYQVSGLLIPTIQDSGFSIFYIIFQLWKVSEPRPSHPSYGGYQPGLGVGEASR